VTNTESRISLAKDPLQANAKEPRSNPTFVYVYLLIGCTYIISINVYFYMIFQGYLESLARAWASDKAIL